MASIWVIEQGSYSDYRVCGVFSTKENAEIVLSRMDKDGYKDPTIDEWPLDPSVEATKAGLTLFQIVFNTDGLVYRIRKLDTHNPTVGDSKWNGSWLYHIFAKDQASAIKIATEKHFQHLAEPQL